ncbi:uncharacterized protein I303_100055 [Kwoniella dejecticola CBS 10117]|uniref:N-acetyltransferase domain-containing protein n=1 Tax=Kwoniella dejecticola CBS 10117 TaxID=1296121 RepID=A0A1A6ADX7_9TREE|nr:uncharacterized protein I303_00055 [Kwoniella dejecticola CBS 10117]OBR88244.1 hypothetical protein I303_00055 [Kwoniella dejecticola CBS 10117]
MTDSSTRSSPIRNGPDGPYLPVPGHDLRLTLWREADVDDAVSLFNHPVIGRWSIARPYPYTEAHFGFIASSIPQITQLAQTMGREEDAPPVLAKLAEVPLFPLSALRDTNGRVVGFCSIAKSQKEEGSWEIAYDVHPELQGKGVGTAMLRTMLGCATWLGMERVIAFVDPDNIPSAALLRKVGFTSVQQRILEGQGHGDHLTLFNVFELML